MFEESLVESSSLLRSRNGWPAAISFAAQALILIALITIPLLHPSVIALHTPRLSFLAPPPLPHQPPPPPPTTPIHVTATSSASMTAPAPAPSAPRIIRSSSPPLDNAPTLTPPGLTLGASSNIPFALTSSGGTGTAIRVVPATSTTNSNSGPLHLSTGVSTGLLINPIQPIYPQIAIASRTQGTVIVQAIISKTGHIESAHAVSGPAILQSAAVDAVRNARYHPFLLNGQPTEVDTTISINFRLGS